MPPIIKMTLPNAAVLSKVSLTIDARSCREDDATKPRYTLQPEFVRQPRLAVYRDWLALAFSEKVSDPDGAQHPEGRFGHRVQTPFPQHLCCRGITIALLWGSLVLGCSHDTELYPHSPYEHVSAGFPEIIPLSEEPVPHDQPAYDAYWDRRYEVSKRSLEETILASAPQNEKDLFEAIENARYAGARKLADEILQDDPNSLVGLWAIAHVEAYAEGDMPYALNSIRRARRQAESHAQINPRDPIGQEWYIRTLYTEWYILFSLDRSTEVLEVADRIEEVYAPVPWLKTFTLIKLERFEEARAEIAKYKGLGQWEVDAENSLMVLEDKLKSRTSTLVAAREMCSRFPNQRVLQYNLGLAAVTSASFGEAEQAFIAAANIVDTTLDSSPYVPLASLLIQQGRFVEAIDALKQAQVDRGLREAYTLQQDEAIINLAIATALLTYNESDLALRFARRATDAPDRAAFTNVAEQEFRISAGLILWTILKYKREELQEQLSFGAVPTTASLAQLASMQASLWTTKQKLISELKASHVIDLVSPFKPGVAGIETQVQSWHRFMLIDLIPLGVLEAAITRAENAETLPWVPPYLNAIRAGIRWQKNDYVGALHLAQLALDELPPRAEKVFRAFVAAIAGQAAWQLGHTDKAIGYWNATLSDFPQAFRLLGIRVPIRMTDRLASDSHSIAATLAGSSRFFESDRGYEIIVRPFENQQMLIEMFRNDQSRHMELVVSIAADDGFAETTVDQFHEKFFQPLVELTQTDLGSLDGSPVAARMRREVDQLFSDFIQSDESDTESTPGHNREKE